MMNEIYERIIEETQQGDFSIITKEVEEIYELPYRTRLFYELFFNNPKLLEKLIKDHNKAWDKFMDAEYYLATIDPEDGEYLEHLQHILWRKMTIISNLLGSDSGLLGGKKTSIFTVEYDPSRNPERYHEYTWEEDDDFDDDFIIEDVDGEYDDIEDIDEE